MTKPEVKDFVIRLSLPGLTERRTPNEGGMERCRAG
jgi:hypothetical protein